MVKDSRMIREAVESLRNEVNITLESIRALQEQCNHKTSVYSCHGSTGNWDRDDSYWYMHYCYDCQKRWSIDQKYKPQASLRVKEIDYNSDPKVVELEIQISELEKTSSTKKKDLPF